RLDRWYRAKQILKQRGNPLAPDEFVAALNDDLNTPQAISIIDELANDALRLRERADSQEGSEKKKLISQAANFARQALACGELLGLLNLTYRERFQGPSSQLRGTARIHFKVTGTLSADYTTEGIENLIAVRAEAKAQRDFQKADQIREQLKAGRIVLEDGPDGTKWRRE
ncbi:MAG: DALR domain-containing protein, partial [Sphingomicrobium sp.]